MYSCESCGKSYKFPGGLNNHKARCGGASASSAGGGGVVAGAAAAAAGGGANDDDITKSPFFTIPLTSFKPTANFTIRP